MSNVPIAEPPHEEPFSGPGGPMPAVDNRPEYSPTALVVDIMAMLRSLGLQIEAEPLMLHTASIAAGDLLRAIGVRPRNLPLTPPKKRRA